VSLAVRIREIINENHLKQKDFANSINVTESYISKLLRGDSGLSRSTATLIEEKYGYSLDWILSGDEPKVRRASKSRRLSPTHKKILADLEQMDEQELTAVIAFMESLKNVRKSFETQPPSHGNS